MNVFIDDLIDLLEHGNVRPSLAAWHQAVGRRCARAAAVRFLRAGKGEGATIGMDPEAIVAAAWIIDHAGAIPGSDIFRLRHDRLELGEAVDAGYRAQLRQHITDTYHPPVTISQHQRPRSVWDEVVIIALVAAALSLLACILWALWLGLSVLGLR